MIKKTPVICLLLVFIFNSISSLAQDTTSTNNYTLQQCVDIAIHNNPTVKSYEFAMANDRVGLTEAIGNVLPSLNGGASRELSNGKFINPYTNTYIDQSNTYDSYSLSGGLTLWNGSSILNYIRQNSLAYKAGKLDLQTAKDQAAISVILDYLAVLNAQEQLGTVMSQAEVSKETVDRLNLENDQGNIAPSDLYNAKGQLSSSELAVLNNRFALQNAKLSLSQVMNIPLDTAMQLEPLDASVLAPYSDSINQIYQYALENLPQVKAAELHEQSALKGIKSARGRLFPTLSFFYGLQTNYSNAATTSQLVSTSDQQTPDYVLINNSKEPVFSPVSNYNSVLIPYGNQFTGNLGTYVGLNLSIPILNHLSARGAVLQAKVAEDQTSFNLSTSKIQLKQAIQGDYLQMMTAFGSYKNWTDQVNDYTESFREAKIKFEAGSITSVDFIIVQNNLNQAQLSLIAEKYYYLLYTKILDYYQGKLGISTTGK